MTVRVPVAPALLEWAVARSGRDRSELLARFPKLPEWLVGNAKPTLKQLESFAKATYAPLGYFFLPEPPNETLPIPDFRTKLGAQVERPSANLLDTIYLCEQRQDWYREHVRAQEGDRPQFIGSLSLDTPVGMAASALRETLDFSVGARREFSSWTQALSGLAERAEALGVLVMISGVVGSNTHRPLDPDEFRGFSIADEYAPVIFINGADTKAAQIFTLVHELAHLWLGQSAVSRPELNGAADNESERWCNAVAAEVLVPRESIKADYNGRTALTDELQRLARRYKVSTLVVLRRVYDAGFLTWDDFREVYEDELARVLKLLGQGGDGGNFYNTQPVRVSKRFARAVVTDTLEGRTRYTEAFHLLGFKKSSTFEELSHKLGVA